MTTSQDDLNSPHRYSHIRSIIDRKYPLKKIYEEVYTKYNACIAKCPSGINVELGSGAGFVKKYIPNIVTTDIIPYPNIDLVMDAVQLNFNKDTVSCICMFNVLHHLPNTPLFFKNAIKCLKKGGRIIMIEPYAGWFSSFIYKYLHHENFDYQTKEWEFESKGPLSDANNALPSIIFERDKSRFITQFPQLSIVKFQPYMPLQYWLAGGLKKWSLISEYAYPIASILDKFLIKLSPRLGSFVEIELVKI